MKATAADPETEDSDEEEEEEATQTNGPAEDLRFSQNFGLRHL